MKGGKRDNRNDECMENVKRRREGKQMKGKKEEKKDRQTKAENKERKKN